jgi:hypothetical protein
MKVKQIESYPVFCFTTKTKISELKAITAEIPPDLFQELEEIKSIAVGPISFVYHGMDGNPATTFDLDIVIPVDKITNAYQGQYLFKNLAPLKCISYDHFGSWNDIAGVYEKVNYFAMNSGHTLNFECREIYQNIKTAKDEMQKSFDNPDNVTEIQMGIQ